MKRKTKKAPAKSAEPSVEIVFDFQKVGLFDFLDLIEVSARQANGEEVSANDTMKMIGMLRASFVSSSRPLTLADFKATIDSFWKSAELFKNPNA